MQSRSRRLELIILGTFIGALLLLPLLNNGSFMGQLPSTTLKFCIYTIMALGLNVVVGYTGQLDLGYVTYMATGMVIVSVAAVSVSDPATGEWIIPMGGRAVEGAQYLFHFPGAVLGALLLAGLVCAGIGVLRGIPTLKLTGDYYAIVTLGIAEIIYIYYRNVNWTGGTKSLSMTPTDMPTLFGITLYYDSWVFYYGIVLATTIALIGSIFLRDSRTGRAMSAIRLDPTAAASCGIPVDRYKMLAFAVSGFIGGVGGGLYAIWSTGFSAVGIEVWESVLLLCCLVLGGMGSIRGTVLGAVVLISLGEVLRQKLPSFSAEQGFHMEQWPQQARFLFYGVILVLLMRFRPEGVLPERYAANPPDDAMLQAYRTEGSPLFTIGGTASASTPAPAAGPEPGA